MIKKQVNLRLNPGTIEQINEIQNEMRIRGFSMSKADTVEEAVHQLYKSMNLHLRQEETNGSSIQSREDGTDRHD